MKHFTRQLISSIVAMIILAILVLPWSVQAGQYSSVFNPKAIKVRKYIIVGSTALDAHLMSTCTAAGNTCAIIRGASAQSGSLIEFQDSSENVLAKIASDGSLTAVAATFTDDITLGDAAADEHAVNGRIASTYYQTVTGAEVAAWNRNHAGGFTVKLAETGTLIKASINDISGGFIAAQLGEHADGITDFNIVGLEAKATVDRDAGGTSVGKGLYAKMIVRKTGTTLAEGHAVYGLIEVNNSAVITTASNFYADLDNEASLGTVAVVSTAAKVWDTGIDLDNATLTNDIVLQNGEAIQNDVDDEITLGGGFVSKHYTSDPCSGKTEGFMFYNVTGHFWCYCNGSNDVKFLDDSTACF